MLPRMEIADPRQSGVLAALLALCVAGIADVGEFIATRPGLFTTAPGRVAGSILGLGLWAALAATTAGRLRGADGPRSRRTTVGLAALIALGNLGLTAVHLKAGVGSARTIAAGLLGVAALALALVSLGAPAVRRA